MLNRWRSCIARLESEMPSEQFRPWIKPLRFLGYIESEHKLRVGVRSAYKLNLIKDQFEAQLMTVVREIFSPQTTISLELHTLDDLDPLSEAPNLAPNFDDNGSEGAALGTPSDGPACLDIDDIVALPINERISITPKPVDARPRDDEDDDISHFDRASRLRRDLTFAEFVEATTL
jgi:chromosomal replication initiation ATPase DnaA